MISNDAVERAIDAGRQAFQNYCGEESAVEAAIRAALSVAALPTTPTAMPLDEDAPDRIWLSAADSDNERQFWTDPDEGGTEYVRVQQPEQVIRAAVVECAEFAKRVILSDARTKLPKGEKKRTPEELASLVYNSLVRSKPTAALAAAIPTGAVKVKALEWSEIEHDRGDGQTDTNGEWEAGSIVGTYAVNISICGDMHAPWEAFGGDDSKIGNFDTLEAAKAAAQADFERRIRSALVSPETPVGDRQAGLTITGEAQFRKKPVVIDAFQMTIDRRMDNSDWPSWINRAWNTDRNDTGALQRVSMDAALPDMLQIVTLEGLHLVSWGDWIIRGVKGELYPCKPDIFEATYEPATVSPAPDERAVEALPEGTLAVHGKDVVIAYDDFKDARLAFDILETALAQSAGGSQ